MCYDKDKYQQNPGRLDMRLLVADDDRDIAKVLTALFERNGYSVDVV